MDELVLIHSYVALHNDGVQTGSFQSMLELFHHEAELRFEGIDYGPFNGREAIGKAFITNPPDDELELFDVTEAGAGISVTYGWRKKPGVVAGTLHIEAKAGLIKQLVVDILGRQW